MKRIVSLLSALVLTCTIFSGALPVIAEETQSANQPAIENEISVNGTNSFGNLLSDELSGKMDEQQENNGCNVFSAEVIGKDATVSFETTEDGTIIAAIYDEAGNQMIASGSTEVTKGETKKTVTIETDSMPKYFYLRVFLADTNTLRPICTAYESPNYTQEMQEFFAKTVDDFASEKVLNLDEDKSNNFLVFGEDTKVIKSDGIVNKVAKSDEENGIYVIENADSSITSLVKGDIFALEQPDGNVLIVKVGTIKISGKTVTITDQDTSMEDVFEYVKIDESQDMSNVEVDTSNMDKGIIYNGMIDETPDTYSYRRAESPYSINMPEKYDIQAAEGDFSLGKKLSFTFTPSVESGNLSASISGGLTFKEEVVLKYYISSKHQYLELKINDEAEVSLKATAAVKAVEFELPPIEFPFYKVINVKITPKFVVEFSGAVELDGKWTETTGFYVSDNENIRNISSSPQFEVAELKAEVTVFIGFILEPDINIIDNHIAKVGLEAKVGVEMTASKSLWTTDKSASSKHECKNCIEGDITAKCSFSFIAQLLNLKSLKYRLTIHEMSKKLTDFYYSFDHKEFGWGTCPYKKNKVSICVKDENGNFVSGAEITASGSSNDVSGETNEKGRFETWLSNDDYFTFASKGDKYAYRNFTVNEPKNVFMVIKPKSEDPDISSGSTSKAVKQFVQGDNFSAILTKDGYLYMLGQNDAGQLGNGTTEDSSTPIKIMSGVKFVTISPSPYHRVAAIKEDGSLYMWGENDYGTLGNGTTEDSSTPIKIMSNVESVSVGESSTAAITKNNVLYIWGANTYASTPTKVMNNVISVSLLWSLKFALSSNGSLYSVEWDSDKKEFTPEKIMDNVKYNNAPQRTMITNDGNLYIWEKEQEKIMGNVKSVSVGIDENGNRVTYAAITNDDSLYMWGNNSYGQLGNGTTEDSSTPIKIMDNVKSVSLGWDQSAAITNNGSLYMWGTNYGQLGNGEAGRFSSTPIKIMDNVNSVSISVGLGSAITKDGSLYVWGSNQSIIAYAYATGNISDSSTFPIKVTIPPASAKTITNFTYLANEPTLQTEEFTGLLPNEVYNFYSIADGELLYVSQGVSDENGNLNVSYIPKSDDTDAEIFLKGMTRTDISGAKVTVPDILCNGEEQFAQPVVTHDGMTLSEADYDIAMQYSAVYPGEYDITIVGVGDYIGEVKAFYNVYCKHSFSDGKCTVCKSLESTLGDVNEDGAVGVADIVALQKFLVRKKTAFPKNGDVNSDGAVNVFDVVKLKRILIYS